MDGFTPQGMSINANCADQGFGAGSLAGRVGPARYEREANVA